MTALQGFSLENHLKLLNTEYKFNKTIYAYPDKKIFRGIENFDLSANLYGEPVFTPLGPAAGPHTQLAQNIIVAFLAGARIFELKTIQINDQIEIPRPCIDIRNIGFNVEWSQELSLNESLREYVKAWLLLKYLKKAGIPKLVRDPAFYDFVFDVSIGYSFDGISSHSINNWLNHIKNPAPIIEELITDLPKKYWKVFENIDPAPISQSITLSTFHGCPPGEIEKIAEYLISESGFHVIIKFNPTLLGYDRVADILHEDLGYRHIQINQDNFKNDLQFTDAIKMMKRLKEIAKKNNRQIGAKFTNTLIVKNTESLFKEPVRYLSGAPLYTIAMQTLHDFRSAFGSDIPYSFSGGIDSNNFAHTVAENIIPVTTCTDILKKGGYSRLNNYLHNLKQAMDDQGVKSLKEFIKSNSAKNKSHETISSKSVQLDRYRHNQNSDVPKKIPKKLRQFDCINCDICLKVCPNLALFSFDFNLQSVGGHSIVIDQGVISKGKKEKITLKHEKQIMVIRDACNSCGNCQTFCPETGDPQQAKLNLFFNAAFYDESNEYEGFHIKSGKEIVIKFNRTYTRVVYNQETGLYHWFLPLGEFEIDEKNNITAFHTKESNSEKREISILPFLLARSFLSSVSGGMSKYPLNFVDKLSKRS